MPRELVNRSVLPPAVADAFDELIDDLNSTLVTNGDGSLDALPSGFSYVPIGGILLWPTSAIPSGWLRCNGATVNRSAYAKLFRVIGITFGAGNGTTTFTLPTLADVGTSHYIIATGAV